MSPPAASLLTPALISSLRATPRLPHHTWYYITGVTLSALNRPEEIPSVLSYALKNGVGPEDKTPPAEEEQLKIARRMREGLVKSVAVIGLPKTINALLSLKASTPPHLLDPPTTTTPSGRHSDIDSSTKASSILTRGTRLFDHIYGKISNRVMGQMAQSGTEDLSLVAKVAYGYILSGGQAVLGGEDAAPEVSWVLIAGLVPQDVNPQLKGHLKGAVNLGASAEEVRAVRGLAVRVCEIVGMSVGGQGGWREEVENIPEGWTPPATAGKAKI